ncbi:MAG: hypothetical protein IJM12_06805 [Bacteroidales bacterium]|nr:hypothetical protein [Bacteroidales bacterium]
MKPTDVYLLYLSDSHNPARIINITVSTCLGAAGQIKRLVFDTLTCPNEEMGNFSTD